MMYKTSLVGIVLKSEPHKLFLWDDTLKKSLSQLTFATDIKGVKMRKDLYEYLLYYDLKLRISVALNNSVFAFNISNFECVEVIQTIDNPTGILAVSTAEKPVKIIVACPHKVDCIVAIHSYRNKSFQNLQSIVFKKMISLNIVAHQNSITALAINPQGTLLATASIKGTILRIFCTQSGRMLQELRRGSKSAYINQIIFHPTSHLLACCSDRPTIHVFELSKTDQQLDYQLQSNQSTLQTFPTKIQEQEIDHSNQLHAFRIPQAESEDRQDYQGVQGDMQQENKKKQDDQKNKTSRLAFSCFFHFNCQIFIHEICSSILQKRVVLLQNQNSSKSEVMLLWSVEYYCKQIENFYIIKFTPIVITEDRTLYYGQIPEKTGYCSNKIIKMYR